MTDTESYNGWKNRETWAFNLHWQNDQGLYYDTLTHAREALAQDDELSDYGLGETVIDFWQSYVYDVEDEGAKLPETIAMMVKEVGSWWRVDETETGACVRESLDDES